VLKAVPDTLTINHATVDPDSKDDTPAIRACYRTDLGPAPGCDEATAITTVVVEATGILPGYMTMSGDVLTVAPTSNSQSATYTLLVTHSTTFEDDPISFNTVTVTVSDCVITHVDPPTDPGAQAYTVHALSDLNLDLSAAAGNLGFVQKPACAYTLTEILAWSFNPSPAPPITTNSGQPY
jgi:hypothetical protein